jgi:hypothetical protein
MIGLAAPYELLPSTAQDLENIIALAQKLGQIQLPSFFDGYKPPLLLMTGESDTTVRSTNFITLARRVRETGGRLRLVGYQVGGHVGLLLALAVLLRRLSPVFKGATVFIRRTPALGADRLRRKPVSFNIRIADRRLARRLAFGVPRHTYYYPSLCPIGP